MASTLTGRPFQILLVLAGLLGVRCGDEAVRPAVPLLSLDANIRPRLSGQEVVVDAVLTNVSSSAVRTSCGLGFSLRAPGVVEGPCPIAPSPVACVSGGRVLGPGMQSADTWSFNGILTGPDCAPLIAPAGHYVLLVTGQAQPPCDTPCRVIGTVETVVRFDWP